MRKFFSRARKNMAVGWSSTLKAVGFHPDEEDPAYIEHSRTLDRIRDHAKTVLLALNGYSFAVQEMGKSSETIHGYLRDVGAGDNQVMAITAYHLESQVIAHCLAPIRQLNDRIDRLDEVVRRRRQNKEMASLTSNEAEKAHRSAKYATYHNAFVAGVDCLAEIAPPLFASVFAQMQFSVQEYVRGLATNLRGTQWFVQAPVQAEAPPDAPAEAEPQAEAEALGEPPAEAEPQAEAEALGEPPAEAVAAG
jgi:hypothetical protein